MYHHAGLVVCSSPAIEPALALDRFERWRSPLSRVPGWLHVMVAVEQDRRLARRCRLAGHDCRRTALDLEDLHILHIASAQQGHYGLGRRADVTGGRRIGAYRGDTDQALEIL